MSGRMQYLEKVSIYDRSIDKYGIYYDPEKGYLYSVSAKNCRKIYNEFDISKILSDGEELIFYRLSRYLSPYTNILVNKANHFEPMNFRDIIRVTNRGESTIRRFLDKCKKNHIIAIFSKSYKQKVYKIYGVNPFVACAGSGWINVYMYQMWKDECVKYLKPNVLKRLEEDSGYKTEEPFKIKNGMIYESKQIFKY